MAAVALLSWPLIALIFFRVLGAPRGLIWSTVVGYLFLPESYGFDVSALPPYNKLSAISYAALLGVLIFRERKADMELVSVDTTFRNIQILVFAVLLFISPILTWQANPETLVNGPVVRPGLSIRDAIRLSMIVIVWFLPMFLAWRVLTRPEHHRELLFAIVVFAVVYSFPVLFEWRMAPRFNVWIYGYFQSDWIQHIRGGGFRPIVFLQHGLVVGFFLMTSVLAAFALSRDKKMSRGAFVLIGCWLFLVLFMSRNFGSTFLALVFLPVILFFGPRMQMRLVTLVVLFFLSFPFIKHLGLSPIDNLLPFFEALSPQRAASLEVRLINETDLLARAMEKPLFGWGGWARAHILNEFGRDLTLIDGLWIVMLGQRGWVGFLAYFGFIVMPLFFLMRASRRKPLSSAIVGMATIMGANLLDLIPNSTLSPLAMLMAGALAAYVQFDQRQEADETATQPTPADGRATARYTRFGPNAGQQGRTVKAASYPRPSNVTLRRE